MLDIDYYCGYDNITRALDLSTIVIVETASEPDAIGHLVTIRDVSGNLHWGFRGSSSDGDRWIRVGSLDMASTDFDFFRTCCEEVWERDFESFTSAADLGCPID